MTTAAAGAGAASAQVAPAGGAGAESEQHRQGRLVLRAMFAAESPWVRDFDNLKYEWRRLFAELMGTFLLVLVGAGAGVVSAVSGGQIGRTAAVVAPALMVAAIILGMGAVSGAHLNPIVTAGFALRGDFPWRRVPGYIVAQLAGATLACLFLWAMFGKVAHLGATVPGVHINGQHAMWIEAVITFGLVTIILGTASGAQNVGPLSAVGVSGYIALAGLWSSPISGASMNPARSFGPALVSGHWTDFWVYVAGPAIGALVAVGSAWVLRGPGGDLSAARAAQGTLDSLVLRTRGVEGVPETADGGPGATGDPT